MRTCSRYHCSSMGNLRSQMGTWCSGITSASHAEGPGFKSQCVHFSCCVRLAPSRSLRPRTKHTTASTCWQIRCSIVVSISACHAEDPGSIPGGGVFSGRGLLCLRFLAKALLCLGCAALITSIRSPCCPALEALCSCCRRRGSISSAEWRSG